MLNYHEFLHTLHKYILNSIVKISTMFAQYFEYYAIILRGGRFCEHAVYIEPCKVLTVGRTKTPKPHAP